MTDDDPDTVRRDFREAVSLSAAELERWLDSDESKEVGQESDGGGESTGHASGRRIVELLRTDKDDLTSDEPGPHAQGPRLRAAPPRPAPAEGRHRDVEVALLADELGPRPAPAGVT